MIYKIRTYADLLETLKVLTPDQLKMDVSLCLNDGQDDEADIFLKELEVKEPDENGEGWVNFKQNTMKSDCCQADMIEPNEDEIEAAGSLWRAYACYICKECYKVCEPIQEEE